MPRPGLYLEKTTAPLDFDLHMPNLVSPVQSGELIINLSTTKEHLAQVAAGPVFCVIRTPEDNIQLSAKAHEQPAELLLGQSYALGHFQFRQSVTLSPLDLNSSTILLDHKTNAMMVVDNHQDRGPQSVSMLVLR